MNIVLIGASGLVGSELIKLLIDDPKKRNIYCLSRRALPGHPQITNIVLNFENLANLKHDFPGACFISCLGTTIKEAKSKEAFHQVDFNYNYQFAKLAEKNKAPFILVSAVGASSHSSVYYSQVKGELEDKIRKLSLPSLYIIQPSLLLGDRKNARPLENIMQKVAPRVSCLFKGALSKYHPIKAKDLAKAIQKISLRPKEGFHKLTYQEIMNLKKIY